MDTVELLGNLGLTQQETQVYLSLLERGSLLVSHLGRDTGLHRPTVYTALSGLRKKNLVTVAPKGRQKFYHAESPEKLQFIFGTLKAEYEKLLPVLKAMHQHQGRRPMVRFWEGRNGMRGVLEDIQHTLKSGDTYYRYCSQQAIAAMGRHLVTDFQHWQTTNHIQRFVITDALADWQKTSNMNRSYKVVPAGSDLLRENILMAIYADKVAFGDAINETGVIIESPTFAAMQRKIFMTLYQQL
ncbi:MAG: helix-turn-helix domain-containing protein [Patescibacteria group bacterium]|nr:helix-turn-helix domain-containing protein [Patescibacteria group bacterium]